MRLLLMIISVALLSVILSACGRWTPGYIITEDGTMLSNSDVNQRDVTIQTISTQLDQQLGEHWRTLISLPELPVYESDDRNLSVSWMWEKANVTVTLVGDGTVPLTLSEKEIHAEVTDYLSRKVHQPKKNLMVVVLQKVDPTQFAELKQPIKSTKMDTTQPRHYQVQTGDTWADLSQAYYGSAQHWRFLSDANQGGELTAGRQLVIPAKP